MRVAVKGSSANLTPPAAGVPSSADSWATTNLAFRNSASRGEL